MIAPELRSSIKTGHRKAVREIFTFAIVFHVINSRPRNVRVASESVRLSKAVSSARGDLRLARVGGAELDAAVRWRLLPWDRVSE
jgi:hypothetical protein